MSWIQEQLARRAGQPQQAPPGVQNPYPSAGVARTVAPPPNVPGYPGQMPPAMVQPNGAIFVPEGVQLSAYQRAAAAVGDKGRTSLCPECGEDALYQVTTGENGMPLRNGLPRPNCMNCGYPNMQAGSLHGGASVAKPSGPAKRARQLVDHVVQVFDSNGRAVDAYEPQVSSIASRYV